MDKNTNKHNKSQTQKQEFRFRRVSSSYHSSLILLFRTKLTWVWWYGFNFRKPSCKDKNNDYYPVINTHITDKKAAHECPRYSEGGAKDVGQIHDRLNNILGPGKGSALGPLPTSLTPTGIKL